jgi:hypothetical protein
LKLIFSHEGLKKKKKKKKKKKVMIMMMLIMGSIKLLGFR